MSGVALTIASLGEIIFRKGINTNTIPPLTGPILAIIIITIAFGYGFATRNRKKTEDTDKEIQQKELQNKHANHYSKNINHVFLDYY